MRDINHELAKLAYPSHPHRSNLMPKQFNQMNFADVPFLASLNAAPFDPADVANYYAHYDISDASTVTKDGSDRISAIDNKEGTAVRDLAQATAGNQPLWLSADQNSLDVMSFDSNARGMRSGTISLTSAMSFFLACKLPNDGIGHANVFFGGTAAANENIVKGTTNGEFTLDSGSDIVNGTTGKVNTWQYVHVKEDNANSELDIGGDSATGTTATNLIWDIIQINAYNIFDFGGIWKLGEFLMYDAVVSAPNRASIISYLQTKWSLP